MKIKHKITGEIRNINNRYWKDMLSHIREAKMSNNWEDITPPSKPPSQAQIEWRKEFIKRWGKS